MNRSKTAVLIGLMALLCIRKTAPAQDANRKLETFFNQYLEESFRQRPALATSLGDHRFDHLLDDVSPAARAGWLDHKRKTLKALPKAVKYADLSRDGQIDFEIFTHDLETEIWLGGNTHASERDPRPHGSDSGGSC